jgi:phosphate starvation-inducible protein PhoH and related proteins
MSRHNDKKKDKSHRHNKPEVPETPQEKTDKSPNVFQREKLKYPLTIYQRTDFTDRQKEFIDLAFRKETKVMLVSGPAGTAKTYLAVYVALSLLSDKRFDEIIYVRSAVESSDSKLGFLPGESADKMAPYIEPLIQKLLEMLPAADIKMLQSEQRVNGLPIGFLRGLNWDVKCIIADEAQNMTHKEIVTLMTRIGKFSKLFLTGDPYQSDINSKSGFKKMFDHFNDEESRANGIYTFEFTEEDIVRSPLVRFIFEKIKKMVPDKSH